MRDHCTPDEALRAHFRELVAPEIDRLLAFAGRRLASETDAEDLVQEVCLRAWGGFVELRESDRVRAWLYRICRTLLSEHYRARARKHALVSLIRLEAAHEVELASGAPNPLEETLARLTSEQVHRALKAIPEDFAIALELHDIDGFRYREIADITGVPIGTVMSRISRGRKLLAGVIAIHEGTRDLKRGDRSLINPSLPRKCDGR